MRNHSRFTSASVRATLVALLVVALPAASCNTSDSIGALHDGGRADGKSGTGGGTGAGTGGGAGVGGGVGTGGGTGAGTGGRTGTGTGGGIGTDGGTGTGGGIGTGGRLGTGGGAGTGFGGGTGTGGRTGTGGALGTGGGADAALDAHECTITDVYCTFGYVLDAYGCMVCAPDGTGGSGGSAGKGGAGGGGGSGGAAGTRDAGQDGAIVCGSATCATGEYCCNAACNLCAPQGYGCIQGCGSDAAQAVDSNGCKAVPSSDSTFCGGSYPPHYYVCQMTMLDAPCATMTIGNMTNSFCCP